MRDKSYRAFPIGQEAGHYLRAKRKRLTASSYRDYECCLDKLARYFADLEIGDLEPPVGTQRLEEFLDDQWGERAAAPTTRTSPSCATSSSSMCCAGNLHGDPTLAIERARKREVYRTTFTNDQIRAIIAAQDELRDRVAVRLLLDYGLRKGALQGDPVQALRPPPQAPRRCSRRASRVRELPIPHPEFWFDLERLILESEAEPGHYLIPQQTTRASRYEHRRPVEWRIRRFPEKPMGDHGLHTWWYACLERAGVVAQGTTSGERMHKARHTAGQRVLDATGNLKATQKLLGHASIQTTGDVYADWDIDQLAGDDANRLGGRKVNHSRPPFESSCK